MASKKGKAQPTRRKVTQVGKRTDPLGEFLTQQRLELDLAQQEVARRVGISCSVLSHVETGQLHPNPNLLDKLAKVLGCRIPPELIPSPRDRNNNGYNGPRYITERKTALGKFVTTRRLELGLSQQQVASKAGAAIGRVAAIERGTYCPGRRIVEKLSKALECEIPVELMSEVGKREPRGRTAQGAPAPSVMVYPLNQSLSDLVRIKKLSDIRTNDEAVRKALKLLRRLLEKQSGGCAVYLRKGKDIVELEFLF